MDVLDGGCRVLVASTTSRWGSEGRFARRLSKEPRVETAALTTRKDESAKVRKCESGWILIIARGVDPTRGRLSYPPAGLLSYSPIHNYPWTNQRPSADAALVIHPLHPSHCNSFCICPQASTNTPVSGTRQNRSQSPLQHHSLG